MGELDLNVSALVLQAVCQAQEEGQKRMGRDFGSLHEIWAALKEGLETADRAGSPAAKLHKEMWDAVKDRNEEAALALARAMQNTAAQAAMEWVRLAACAARAVKGM